MGAPFVWFDLTVADGATIAGFYQGLFGWETGPGGALIALFTPAAG